MFLGIDIGSVSVKALLLAEKVEWSGYERHQGQPLPALLRILKTAPLEKATAAAFTGAGGKLAAELCRLPCINEVKALSLAAVMLFPKVSTLIEIGGQDSKLLLFNNNFMLADFAMNSLCAAGTGSFLDQQASRLEISIEDFGKLALKSKNPPRIAGRCSVFAKSDMIHLQQKATPVEDILAGLCLAMVRNFKSTIGKGKDFEKPIAFVGGVAANSGMVLAFEKILELNPGELIVPREHHLACAVGAALYAREIGKTAALNPGLIENYLKQKTERGKGLEPLNRIRFSRPAFHVSSYDRGKVRAFLGVDVGSISTNVVVMDESKNVLAKRYLMTAGRPLEAVCKGLAEVGAEVGDKVEIVGACTTGSGRYLTGDFIGADVVKNEITAQARAAIEIDKTVDTIFEIGGQDSKYISVDNGAIVDFEMNKACAAGTGSYLEEQSEKLGISIKEEFAKSAFSSGCPAGLGERCTVFMESDVTQNLQKGIPNQDIVAGLAYSIVSNYLNRVVQNKRVGNRIFFQGGVAFNQAVVAAFEKVTGKKITVPPHHEVTGAIGCCLLAQEHMRQKGLIQSKFKGFDVSRIKYAVSSFECKACANNCEVNRVAVAVEGGKTLFYGHRCERYDVDKKKADNQIPDLFAEREQLLEACSSVNKTGFVADRRKTSVGIPRALFFYWDLLPFFKTFFEELGCQVVLSDKTNREILQSGVEAVLAEPCFPIKVAHGHIQNLLEKKVDYIFLPYIIDLPPPPCPTKETNACPYVSALADMAKAAFNCKNKLISPTIHFRRGAKEVQRVLTEMGKSLGFRRKDVKQAIASAELAQFRFKERIQERGKEILEGLDRQTPALVIIGRPYNTCDPAINLEIPKVLRELGALAMPIDFLPLDGVDLSSEWPNMYWRSGQKILAAAEIISRDARLNAVYLTNFGCGPDSFILHFLKGKLKDKPFLTLEIDEHSADAGAVTRCEAFLDSLQNTKTLKHEFWKPANKLRGFQKEGNRDVQSQVSNRTLYIPNMCDHTYALASAFISQGIKAEVLPESDEETLRWGRKYTSGKECFPALVTTGDIVKLIKRENFDPERSAVFMPTVGGGCRFSYYHQLHRLVINEFGLKNLPIYSPSQSASFYQDLEGLGINFIRRTFQGIVAVDMLEKCLYEKRPCEKEKGSADKVYQKYLEAVRQALIERKKLLPLLCDAAEEFSSLPQSKNGKRPQIGIVGEIFVRSHRFSNENLIRKIEELGGGACMPTTSEWLIYLNFVRFRETEIKGRYYDYFINWLTTAIQKRDLKKLEAPFEFLENFHEPPMPKIEEWASSYINPSCRGEVVLGYGKATDFLKKGAAGIINVIPFTCMPGNVTTAMIKQFREENQDIPFISIAYDGLNETSNYARLEAFMDQCRQRMAFHSLE